MTSERKTVSPKFPDWIRSAIGAMLHRENSTPELNLIEQIAGSLVEYISEGGFRVIDYTLSDKQHLYFEVIVSGQMGQEYRITVGPSELNLLSEPNEDLYLLQISELPLDGPVFRVAEIPIKNWKFDKSAKGLSFTENTGNGLHITTKVLNPTQRLQFLNQLQTTKVNHAETMQSFEKLSAASEYRSIDWMNGLRIDSRPPVALPITRSTV